MKVSFWYPSRAYQDIKDQVLPEIDRVLTKGDLILREDVEKFEENFAKYVGTKYAVGVASCTDALQLTLRALGITSGEVIAPAYTFRATHEAIHHAGATPVLTDIGQSWKDKQGATTKAIIPAHIAGEVLDWEPTANVLMIEDAAQAIGAAPIKGIAACYSFYPAKILGCYGDGGAIATDNKYLYQDLLKLRNHCKPDWADYGYNSRLDNVQAAVLNIKLKHLPKYIKRRKQIAEKYDKALKDLPITLPTKREVYQDYIIQTNDRERLHSFLTEYGIETMRNEYPLPSVLTKPPKASYYEATSLRLPCTPEHTDQEIDYVIEAIQKFYE